MKTIEIYIDESGVMDSQKPMNVTGLTLLLPDVDQSESFHAQFYDRVKQKKCLAGRCSNAPGKSGSISAPREYLKKRLPKGVSAAEAQQQQGKLTEFVSSAVETAKQYGITISAFSLQFPAIAFPPWEAANDWEVSLLDRSYIERVKDLLELLLFETPWINMALQADCVLSLDLPTRSVKVEGTQVPAGLSLTEVSDYAWTTWGLRNDRQNVRELGAASVSPEDGGGILTEVITRRRNNPVHRLKVQRARCVRLMDWDTWTRDCPTANARNAWSQKYLPPKQIHYLADFLANAIYRSGELLHNKTVQEWFKDGFQLDACNDAVDPWIEAMRAFANKDRVGAIETLGRSAAANAAGEQFGFFRSRAAKWSQEIEGAELRRLFQIQLDA